MTRISAYTSLQDQFGKEQAQALAEFIESQDGPDLSRYTSKEDIQAVRQDLKNDIQAVKQDLKDLELRLTKDLSKTREDLSKEIAKSREDMITRMNWSTIIQVITTVGALVALAKIF